jgi:hypothetical protein
MVLFQFLSNYTKTLLLSMEDNNLCTSIYKSFGHGGNGKLTKDLPNAK